MITTSSHPFQVLTGRRPFHHIVACTPVPAVLRGERPRKPLDAESLGFSEALWELIQLCWSQSSSTRPTAQQLLDHLSSAFPGWIPPPVYPATVIDSHSTADTGSFSLLSQMTSQISRGVGTVTSIGGSLVFIFVLLFFLST